MLKPIFIFQILISINIPFFAIYILAANIIVAPSRAVTVPVSVVVIVAVIVAVIIMCAAEIVCIIITEIAGGVGVICAVTASSTQIKYRFLGDF